MRMKSYKHLSAGERSQIEVLLKLGYSQRRIAEVLCRPQSTISREVRRNTRGKEWYLGSRAHNRSMKRGYWQRWKAPLKNKEVWDYVLKKLKSRWSPEIIAGRLPTDLPGESIHHETIYRYIYSIKSQHMQLYSYLKQHRKKRLKKYGRKIKSVPVAERVMISERPHKVELREEFGHWETDNMEGKKSDSQVITVTVERKTRYMRADLIARGSKQKKEHIVERLQNLPALTITTDNGSENAGHREWRKQLQTEVYFCNPYHSWEKGSVENAIGRIRRYIPRRRSIQDLTEGKLRWVVGEYNNTPRKVLNYRTPKEVFMRELANSK